MRYFFNNALYRAFSISTRCYGKFKSVRGLVSMPFIGLLPFLPWRKMAVVRLTIACQCPLSGFFHFYMKNDLLGRLEEVMCQCPLSGFFHFYLKRSSLELLLLVRVNALYQASSISTLPSGNALKWSICRLDFAGNCLTTSKSAYFLLFLCLFTLCSYFVTVQHKKIIDNTMSLFIVLSIIFLW